MTPVARRQSQWLWIFIAGVVIFAIFELEKVIIRRWKS